MPTGKRSGCPHAGRPETPTSSQLKGTLAVSSRDRPPGHAEGSGPTPGGQTSRAHLRAPGPLLGAGGPGARPCGETRG